MCFGESVEQFVSETIGEFGYEGSRFCYGWDNESGVYIQSLNANEPELLEDLLSCLNIHCKKNRYSEFVRI